jgi:hypothetical protein
VRAGQGPGIPGDAPWWSPKPRPVLEPAQAPSPPSFLTRFPDLRRHFVFEYYPWYGTRPVRHWDQWDRAPPDDIAANHYPALGPYDSLDTAVLEQHARWIVETGAGAVNLSWWGPGSFEDRSVHRVMDVMRAHDLKVAFHLEPYEDDRSERFDQDVLYLLREYGEKRRFDAFLLLKDAEGREGPVFKGFRMILPRESTDCHGKTSPVPDYTPDDRWRAKIETLRSVLRGDFARLTFLADSLDFRRAPAAGFDGIAVYDNFVPPSAYPQLAEQASAAGLAFSFNVNPGYDAIEPRYVEPDSCYSPAPFLPPHSFLLDFTTVPGRELAAALARQRIQDSWEATLLVQTDLRLADAERGFFLVYVTSFNEWHEGHAFEPMRDWDALLPAQKALAYHNPGDGAYRAQALAALLRPLLDRPSPAAVAV